MASEQSGKPAFPFAYTAGGEDFEVFYGITKREYFAAKLAPSFVNGQKQPANFWNFIKHLFFLMGFDINVHYAIVSDPEAEAEALIEYTDIILKKLDERPAN